MSEENKLRYIQHNKNKSATNFTRCKLGTKILINYCKIELKFLKTYMKLTIMMKRNNLDLRINGKPELTKVYALK